MNTRTASFFTALLLLASMAFVTGPSAPIQAAIPVESLTLQGLAGANKRIDLDHDHIELQSLFAFIGAEGPFEVQILGDFGDTEVEAKFKKKTIRSILRTLAGDHRLIYELAASDRLVVRQR